MRIDSHQHFWKYDAARHAWITDKMSALTRDFMPADLEPERKANGIDATILVQVDQSEEETLFLLQLAERDASIAGVVGWVDFRSSQVEERLRYFSQFERLRGFRHIAEAEPDDRFLVRDDFVRGIACLRQFGFIYEILIYPKQLRAALELVNRFPQQPFVIDHMAKPEIRARKEANWSAVMREIAANPNVYCKVSGFVTEADWHHWKKEDFRPYLDVVFDAFGPERLMFGSDWPVCLLAANYEQVVQVIGEYVGKYPSDVRAKIFGDNAAQFYRLKTTQHGFAA